jgi:acetolactate synthase regulatory subunit
MVTTVEVLVGDDAEVLSRIVRVVCTRPFALAMLHYWQVPGTRSWRVLMDVVVDGRSELLSKRLNRIASVERVRLLDRSDAPPISKDLR